MPRVLSDSQVPYDVQTAMVNASGKLFWFWEDYSHFLRKSGVHAAVVARLTGSGASKYQVMRDLLAELDGAGSRGRTVQIQLVRGLVALPLTADRGIGVEGAKVAQDELRQAADQHGLLPETKATRDAAVERLAVEQRRKQSMERESQRTGAAERRRSLFEEFCALLGGTADKQGRGYRLEEMIGEVAELDGIRHTTPYRKGTVTQTDGMLNYDGFQYLIEARWRDDPADVAAVAALAMKADRALTSTRGLFLSMNGFRPEVVSELETGMKNTLLMNGAEFAAILEGRFTLKQALAMKVEEGAKKGRIFYDITDVSRR